MKKQILALALALTVVVSDSAVVSAANTIAQSEAAEQEAEEVSEEETEEVLQETEDVSKEETEEVPEESEDVSKEETEEVPEELKEIPQEAAKDPVAVQAVDPVGETITSGDYKYSVNDDGTITVTKYTGTATTVTLDILDGYTISSIGRYAFENNSNLNTVVLADTVQYLDEYAFRNCYNLRKVEWKSSSTSPENQEIRYSAFANCTKLQEIILPKKLTVIGDYAFSNAQSLATVHISTSGENGILPDCLTTIGDYAFSDAIALRAMVIPATVTSVGEYAFQNCKALQQVRMDEGTEQATMGNAVFKNCISLTAIVIPGNYRYISEYAFSGCAGLRQVEYKSSGLVSEPVVEYKAFYDCAQLTTVILPDNLTEIGQYAFYNNTKLYSINFPSALKKIHDYAFKNDISLKNVTIPSSVILVGECAFEGCEKLATVSWNTGTEAAEMGNAVFKNCKSLKSIKIPSNYEYISENAFSGCTALTSVEYVSGSINQTVEYKAFENCTGLQKVILGSRVTALGAYAFYNDISLTTINFPEGLEKIHDYAFCGDKSLKTITIPSTVTYLGRYAFADCAGLTTVTMKFGTNTLASEMGESVFKNCTALTSIKIPGRFSMIPVLAFYNCTSLTSVSYGKGVYDYPYQYVGYKAFEGCTALKSVQLNNTLEEIHNYAFYNNSSLAAITLPEGLTLIGSAAFSGTALKTVTIPSTVTEIDTYAFEKCAKLYAVTFKAGEDVAVINEGAFQNCTALLSVTIPGNYQKIGNYAFQYDTKLQSFMWRPATMILVEGTQTMGRVMFGGCTNLTSVALSKDVVEMRDSIFDNCNSNLVIEGTTDSTVAKTYAGEHGIKFTTGIAAPANLKASAVSSTKVKISWNSVAGASKYILYRKSGSSYVKVAETTSTSYEVNYDNTKAYTYRVKAYGKVFESTNRTSSYSSSINVGMSLATPSSLKAASSSYKSVKLNWKKVSNATGYYIYQKTSSGWKKIKTIKGGSNVSTTISDLTCGKKYVYTVKAYYVNGSIYSYSKYNTTGVAVTVELPKTSITSIGNPSAGKVKITWKKVTGATGYEIYRRVGSSGSYKRIKTITSGSTVSFTDSGRAKGKTHYYRIKAIRKTSGGTVKSAYSTSSKIKVTR